MNERTPPLVQPPDLAALPPVYEFLAARAVAALAVEGGLHPALLALAVPPGATSAVATALIDPQLVDALQRDATRKETLMALVRSLLSVEHPVHQSVADAMGAHPNLIVHVSEAWIVAQPIEAGRESLERFKGSLEHHPARTEAITISMHCLRGSFIGVCPMTRDADGRASATVRPLDTNAETWRGRFNVHSEATELAVVAAAAVSGGAASGTRPQ